MALRNVSASEQKWDMSSVKEVQARIQRWRQMPEVKALCAKIRADREAWINHVLAEIEAKHK